MSEIINTTVEVPEAEVVKQEVIPTREDVKARGWTKAEIESAEKHGLIAKEKKEEEKKEPKAEDKKVDATAQESKEPEEKTEQPKQFEKRASGIPEWTPTPEIEKALSGILPPGDPMRGMYFRMKNERTARQNLQAQLEKERIARTELEAKLNAVKEVNVEESDEDPEDRPLTLRAIKELRIKEQEEATKRDQELHARATAIAEAQEAQEEYAKEIHPDFDDVVGKAKEVIKSLENIPEPWKRAKAVKLLKELQIAAANADSLGIDDYSGAMIAYEIGQLHPSYGQKAEQNGEVFKPEPKANGGHTPEKMKRIEESTLRRASSASVAGGSGKRIVSADDVTLADINKMNTRQRLSFREKYPNQYDKLLRG